MDSRFWVAKEPSSVSPSAYITLVVWASKSSFGSGISTAL
jgi:hypothetical protein